MCMKVFSRRAVRGIPLLLVLLLLPPVRAELHIAQPAANVGEVRGGTALTHRFTFVNRGSETVEITDVRPSCGCLTPRLSRRNVPSGEEGELVLEINTLTQAAGAHTWTVRLSTQSGGQSDETTLSLTAHIISEVSVQPAALTLFADSAVGHEIVLTDRRPRPLSIVNVQTTSPHLQARLAEQQPDAPGVRRIKLELAADCPEGRHDEVVSLFTDDATYRDLRVPVTVVKRPRQRLAATPSRVTLTVPRQGAVPSQLLRIRDGNDEDVEVARVTADDPAILSQWSQGANRVATVKLGVDRKQLPNGTPGGAVHIHIRKPVVETLTVPLTWTLAE
jgi:Protein of unknown function (DUF1573)